MFKTLNGISLTLFYSLLLLLLLMSVGRLHGGVEVVASDNVKLESSSDGRVHTLIIDKVSVGDEGEYTVRASTDSAQISSTANVLIQRTTTYYDTIRTSDSISNWCLNTTNNMCALILPRLWCYINPLLTF